MVAASLLIEWLQPPKVRDNRIDGAAQVSNGSADNFDLTVIIVAVTDNGQATATGTNISRRKPARPMFQRPLATRCPTAST